MARARRVEREVNYEPRLLVPPLPQTTATVGYVAAAGPLLIVPSMAGGDNIDGTALRYLLAHVIEMRKVLEEEERRKKEVKEEEEEEQNDAKLQAHLHAILSSSWNQEQKEEKRRKKRGRRRSFLRPLPPLDVDECSGMFLPGFPGVEQVARCVPIVGRPKMLACVQFASGSHLSGAWCA